MRKKFKDEIDALNFKNNEQKQNYTLLEKDYKSIKDKNSKRKEKLVEMRNIFYDDNPDIVPYNKLEMTKEREKSSKKSIDKPDSQNGTHTLQMHKVDSWKCFMEVEQAAQVRALSSFGGYLYSACKNNVKIWDIAKRREVNQLNFVDKATVRSLITEKKSKSLYIGVSNEIAQYDILSLLCLNKVRINSSV